VLARHHQIVLTLEGPLDALTVALAIDPPWEQSRGKPRF